MSRIKLGFLPFLFPVMLIHMAIAEEPADTIAIKNLLSKASAAMQKNDSALIYANEALRLSKEIASDKYTSLSLQKIGYYYMIKEEYAKSMDYFVEALRIEERRNDKQRIAKLYERLGYIYFNLQEFNLSMDYRKKALEIYITEKDSLNILKMYNNIGGLYDDREFCEYRDSLQKKSDYETAIVFYKKSATISKKIEFTEGYYRAYLNIGNAFRKLGKADEGLPYILKGVDYMRASQNYDGLAPALQALGLCYTKLGQYDKAIACYNECMELSAKFNNYSGILYIYEDIADAFKKSGQYKNALDYFIKFMILRDSLFNVEKSKQIFELERKYNSEKKDQEILNLSMLKKRQKLFIIILVLLTMLVASSAFYLIRRFRYKKIIAEQENKISKQKINELEKEKQLVAINAVLDGEENERRRLARDLHDGLGGLLTGVKLKLANMKGNYFLDEENRADFSNALTMLDSAATELRRVAHNLMPEALIRYGLKDALEDFCKNIETTDVKVIFQFYGTFSRIDQKIETASFRIIQELVNNALKHSGANQIIVQMIQDDNRLGLSVNDNGKGFDVDKVEKSNTVGLQSVKSRVASLNGMIDIFSKEGKGTEITIEFSVK